MRKTGFVLLALLAAAGAAVAYWGPVDKYAVECQRAQTSTCAIQRADSSGVRAWNFTASPETKATVRAVHRRRGGDSVYLYLVTGKDEVFAAEFEGESSYGQASAAAAELNGFFASTTGHARVEASPPANLRWATWGGVAFMALLALAFAYDSRRQKPDAPASG